MCLEVDEFLQPVTLLHFLWTPPTVLWIARFLGSRLKFVNRSISIKKGRKATSIHSSCRNEGEPRLQLLPNPAIPTSIFIEIRAYHRHELSEETTGGRWGWKWSISSDMGWVLSKFSSQELCRKVRSAFAITNTWQADPSSPFFLFQGVVLQITAYMMMPYCTSLLYCDSWHTQNHPILVSL